MSTFAKEGSLKEIRESVIHVLMICYVTGDRDNSETQISKGNQVNLFVIALDAIRPTERNSLVRMEGYCPFRPFHFIPFHSIPFHSIPFHSIPFH